MRVVRLPRVGGYLVATAAVSVTNFFAVPLLVRALGAREFGRWSLLEPVAALLAPIATLGLAFGLIKQISHDGAPPMRTLVAMLRRVSPFLVLGGLVGSAIAVVMAFTGATAVAFGLLICAEAVLAIVLAAFRASSRIFAYGATGIARGVSLLAVLVIAASTGQLVTDAGDVIVWRLLAVLFACGIGYASIRLLRDVDFLAPGSRTDARFDDAIRYGAPILIASLLGLVIEFADRFILAAYVPLDEIGRYVVHIKVAAFLDPLLVQPFALWWPTARFERERDVDRGDVFFSRTASLFLAALLACGGSLWLGAPAFFAWYAPGVGLELSLLLPLILSIVFRAVATPLNVGGVTPGMTHWNAIGVLFGSLINVILCLALIPSFGVVGAAWATLAGYVVYATGLNMISQRIRRIPFAYGRMPLLLLAALVECALLSRWNALSATPQSLLRAAAFALVFLITARLVLGGSLRPELRGPRETLQAASS